MAVKDPGLYVGGFKDGIRLFHAKQDGIYHSYLYIGERLPNVSRKPVSLSEVKINSKNWLLAGMSLSTVVSTNIAILYFNFFIGC